MNKKLTCLIVLIIMCPPAGAMAGPYVEPLDFSPITELGRNMQNYIFQQDQRELQQRQIEMQQRQIEMQERESQQRMRLLQLEIDRTKQEIESREKQRRLELPQRESKMREKRFFNQMIEPTPPPPQRFGIIEKGKID